MPEHVIGAQDSDILHQQKTPEGSLTVIHRTNDIIANTIGHVMAIPTIHTLLGTWSSAFKNPSKELATQLFERYKDVPWKGDVLVRVGHVSIFGDLKRMFARNEDIRGRPWMLKDKVGRIIELIGKAGAAILTTKDAFIAKLFRQDYYNPFANTISVFHPKLALGMHELGHAEWFNQMDKKNRAAYVAGMVNELIYIPFFRTGIEWKASENAMKHFRNDQERRQALKIYEAAWATNLGFDSLVTLAMFAPTLAVPLLNAQLVRLSGKVALGKAAAEWTYGLALQPYASAIAGHMMNRLYPKKEQRFGYIFEGKKPAQSPQELKPYQRLVARAQAH